MRPRARAAGVRALYSLFYILYISLSPPRRLSNFSFEEHTAYARTRAHVRYYSKYTRLSRITRHYTLPLLTSAPLSSSSSSSSSSSLPSHARAHVLSSSAMPLLLPISLSGPIVGRVGAV